MELDDLITCYRNNVSMSENELKHVSKKIFAIGVLRFIAFVCMIIPVIVFWGDSMLFSVFIPTVFFLWLVKKHDYYFRYRDFLKKKIEVNRAESNTLNYDYSAFDSGEEFIDYNHSYTFDLDVFGKSSLFQSVNRCSTEMGKKILAGWFKSHLEDKKAIEERQAGVKELVPDVSFRQNLRIAGLLKNNFSVNVDDLKTWVSVSTCFGNNLFLHYLPYVVAIVNTMALGLMFAGIISEYLFLLLFFSFLVLSTFFSRRITKLQTVYERKADMLLVYAEQMELIEKKNFSSAALLNVKEKLQCSDGSSAFAALSRLLQMMNFLDQRGNVLINVLLNGFMFWELFQIMRIEKWREQHSGELYGWLEAVGELEAYSSLATFSYNNPEYLFPVITDGTFYLRGEDLGHPLIHRDKCVKNGINIGSTPSCIIVTGANMAGKSTYLRTVGVNFLLACIGAPVCAGCFEIVPVRLVTSLRTNDSLINNESYFFAELKRMKMIIDRLSSGERLFIILDEILRGTNSKDKQKGSFAVISQFMKLNTNCIIATHDLQLGVLEDVYPDKVKNFCFEADIENDELVFSYKMRTGTAHNMNACFLMNKMGITVAEDKEDTVI